MTMRQTDELQAALDQIFEIWPRIDLAFSLPSGAWLRPDAIEGNHKRLAGRDRAAVAALERELWARALTGGQGVHWRPASADFALLDDLDGSTARGIIGKYRAVGIETSTGSHQAIIATGRAMTRIEQHQVQSALVQRLHAAGRQWTPWPPVRARAHSSRSRAATAARSRPARRRCLPPAASGRIHAPDSGSEKARSMRGQIEQIRSSASRSSSVCRMLMVLLLSDPWVAPQSLP